MTEKPDRLSEYELVYLAPAQRDLERLRDFLTVNGVAFHRAQEIIMEVILKIRTLKDNPHSGFSLGGKYGYETPYRGLVCGKYLAVFEPIEASTDKAGRIEIRRIYHTREDYLTQLL